MVAPQDSASTQLESPEQPRPLHEQEAAFTYVICSLQLTKMDVMFKPKIQNCPQTVSLYVGARLCVKRGWDGGGWVMVLSGGEMKRCMTIVLMLQPHSLSRRRDLRR